MALEYRKNHKSAKMDKNVEYGNINPEYKSRI
jgi:hypothetical protein